MCAVLSALRAHHVRAVGLSGVDAELVTAHKRPPVEVVDDNGQTQKSTSATSATLIASIRGSSKRCWHRVMCP